MTLYDIGIPQEFWTHTFMVSVNGSPHFYCEKCSTLNRLKHHQGIIYGECRSCNREYILTLEDKEEN
jgi:hypothetical protein